MPRRTHLPSRTVGPPAQVRAGQRRVEVNGGRVGGGHRWVVREGGRAERKREVRRASSTLRDSGHLPLRLRHSSGAGGVVRHRRRVGVRVSDPVTGTRATEGPRERETGGRRTPLLPWTSDPRYHAPGEKEVGRERM